MNREDILLKEYEVCQQHLNTMMSHHWVLLGVFMPVSTALLGVVPYILWNFSKPQWLIIPLGVGVSIILFCLWRYFKRVNAMISVDYFRMREIEAELGMLKNLYVHELDHWNPPKLDNATRERIKSLRAKHIGEIGKRAMGITYWVLIVLWMLAIISAFVVPCIGIIPSSSTIGS
jgi:hypothetical protein